MSLLLSHFHLSHNESWNTRNESCLNNIFTLMLYYVFEYNLNCNISTLAFCSPLPRSPWGMNKCSLFHLFWNPFRFLSGALISPFLVIHFLKNCLHRVHTYAFWDGIYITITCMIYRKYSRIISLIVDLLIHKNITIGISYVKALVWGNRKWHRDNELRARFVQGRSKIKMVIWGRSGRTKKCTHLTNYTLSLCPHNGHQCS